MKGFSQSTLCLKETGQVSIHKNKKYLQSDAACNAPQAPSPLLLCWINTKSHKNSTIVYLL